MDSKLMVERFCYLGGFKPVYVIRHSQIDDIVDDLGNFLKEIDGDSFIAIIEKCLIHNALPRKDELWYTYAAYLASEITDEARITVKSAFSRLAKTSDDLFLFAKYSQFIQDKNNKSGFSKTTKKAITLWYKEQDSNNLIDMWATSTGKHGFKHKDLISLCHINSEELRKDKLLMALANKPRKIIKDNIFTDDNNSNEMKKINEISKFKTTGDLLLAKRLIREKKLKFDNVPTHMLKKIEVWETLIPVMTYRQLLRSIHYLIDRKILDNVPFSKVYLKALGNREAMQIENIHPITFLFERNQLAKQRRYSEAIKQNFYSKKIRPLDIKPNPYLNNKISKIFDHSFDNYKGIGVRTFITINLQENTKRQCVFNQKQVNCYEAAMTLALSYFKSEKSSIVYTYTKDSLKLKHVEWKKNWNFTKANEHCASYMCPKTIQRLILPINEAMNLKEIYDLFLIVVPTATRGNPNNKPNSLIEAFKEYREKKNKNARMVIVNLRRSKSAMIYDDEPHNVQQNIIEICGMDENTPKLINAFASHLFN